MQYKVYPAQHLMYFWLCCASGVGAGIAINGNNLITVGAGDVTYIWSFTSPASSVAGRQLLYQHPDANVTMRSWLEPRTTQPAEAVAIQEVQPCHQDAGR